MSDGRSEGSESELLPRRRRGLSYRIVGDEAFIQDETERMVHFVNGTARIVWECCDGKTSVRECDERIRGSYAVPEAIDLQADIRKVVASLVEKGLLDDPQPAA